MPKAMSIKENFLAKIFRRINWSVSQWWKVEQEGFWVKMGQHSSHTDSYNSTVLSLSYPCCCSSVTDKTDLLGGQVMCLTNHKWKSEQQIQKINPAMCWSFSEQAGKHTYIHTYIFDFLTLMTILALSIYNFVMLVILCHKFWGKAFLWYNWGLAGGGYFGYKRQEKSLEHGFS